MGVDIQSAFTDDVRRHLSPAEHPATMADRDLIERHVDSVVVKLHVLEVRLVPTSEASAPKGPPSAARPLASYRRPPSHFHGRRQALRPAETEIGKWRADTGARKTPVQRRKSRNCLPETR